ncbi:bone morphogenetic protein 10-like [Amblyraja radiata]|uniref:bone morphogenetic protein 10-like n=1 Tax=Amblyraja radiata TaxID=386614 RepID=UPI001403B46B|nr:bone morphogenetic protein 10-like [Amblyraja radiata]
MCSLSLQVFACLCLLLPLAAGSPIDNRAGATEEESRYVLEDDIQEEDSVDFNTLLASMKGEFLKSLNLSGSPPIDAAKVEAPEYMIDLYNRFANDRTSMPSSNIVRSFKNEDTSVSNQTNDVRIHSLLFNVSVPRHEEITMAELRLYTLVDRDRRIYEGVDRKVTIYEVSEGEVEGDTGEEHQGKVQLAKRQIYGRDSGWETFDVTEAILRWSKSEQTTHRLEVHIENMEEEEHEDGDLDIDMKPETKHVPLLIVFSDDRNSIKKEAIEELEQMIDHEQDVVFQSLENGNLGADLNEEAMLQRRSNMLYDTSSRIRRNARGNYCKRSPLYVEFKDIGWDSWIIAPTGYEAYECKGSCYYPLTEHVTPTKHAIVQTLVNIRNPKMAAKASCVPSKLDPISILYLDDAGVVTYKFKYEGMVVAECGCR